MMDNMAMKTRGEVAPLMLLVGDLSVRFLTYAEHLDFLLSVRDTKLATMLQFFRDSGWLLIAIAATLWLAYEYRRHKTDETARGSIGALIFSASLVAFLVGVMVTVSATGTLPMVILTFTGDVGSDICNASIDTSRLVGFADDYRLILICGASDPSIDPQEDTRIAISSKFHINGGTMSITTPLGGVKEVFRSVLATPRPAGTGAGFMLWHCVAVIPQDSDPGTIKRVSDIRRLNGRILTDPVGGFGNLVALPSQASPATPVPTPTSN